MQLFDNFLNLVSCLSLGVVRRTSRFVSTLGTLWALSPIAIFALKSARFQYFNCPPYFTEAVMFKNPCFIRIHG